MSNYVFSGIIYFFSYIENKIYNREKVEVIIKGNIVIHIYCCLSRIEKLSWTFMISMPVISEVGRLRRWKRNMYSGLVCSIRQIVFLRIILKP